ncbi:hypothetical protein QIH87_50040 (plasmid) [Bradyrhizobium elkanii]|uniref:hypothetical protein n=1 Tax=Bradyrhizobium elkanii TaxID=29448 RepID=UPI0027153E26|nr:hypothetical protein [Bradyrhizobium elkanii]WLB14773.1 hypothetical protein QIH87_50040 [Bradyrhizobium elkanii]WLB69135.1 hypothetical protein QIH89_27875 [Bradyrhizobium elkanii]
MTDPRRFGKYSKIIREKDEAFQALTKQMERILGIKDDEIAELREKLKIMEAAAAVGIIRLGGAPQESNHG